MQGGYTTIKAVTSENNGSLFGATFALAYVAGIFVRRVLGWNTLFSTPAHSLVRSISSWLGACSISRCGAALRCSGDACCAHRDSLARLSTPRFSRPQDALLPTAVQAAVMDAELASAKMLPPKQSRGASLFGRGSGAAASPTAPAPAAAAAADAPRPSGAGGAWGNV